MTDRQTETKAEEQKEKADRRNRADRQASHTGAKAEQKAWPGDGVGTDTQGQGLTSREKIPAATPGKQEEQTSKAEKHGRQTTWTGDRHNEVSRPRGGQSRTCADTCVDEHTGGQRTGTE